MATSPVVTLINPNDHVVHVHNPLSRDFRFPVSPWAWSRQRNRTSESFKIETTTPSDYKNELASGMLRRFDPATDKAPINPASFKPVDDPGAQTNFDKGAGDGIPSNVVLSTTAPNRDAPAATLSASPAAAAVPPTIPPIVEKTQAKLPPKVKPVAPTPIDEE